MGSDEEDELQYQVDSDMLGSHHSEDQHEEYMNDLTDQDDNDAEDNSEVNSEGNGEDHEDDSLRRLSEETRRRRMFDSSFGDFEDEEDDEEEGNEDIEMDTADFLRRFIQSRSRQSRNEDHEDQDEEEEDEEEDSHTDFFRAIGSLSGGTRQNPSDRGQGFVDVMQRLMGSGIVFGGRDNGEMEALINNLNQREDTFLILETLNELSEKLLMMNGITAERTIPSNKLAKSLVHIMEDPILAEDLELHLVACRCLYNFIEVNQDFIHDALNNNAIEVLCNALLEISYIDLTEQALQTLEMISRDPVAHNIIVRSNGLQACLQYLDFLTIHAQRKCLTIVANSCTNIQISNFHLVNDVFDNISNVVRNYCDSIVVENGWLAISRIISNFKSKPDLLEDLFANKEELLKEMTEVIFISCNKSSTTEETTKTPLNYSSCLSLIKSLSVIASVSVNISKVLLTSCHIGGVLVKSLNKYSKSKKPLDNKEENSDKISIEALMATPKELLLQFLNLISHLLPFPSHENDSFSNKIVSHSLQSKLQINENRITLYKDIREAYRNFVNDIWFLLINSFQATMDLEIRHKVLSNLRKIVAFTSKEDFQKIEGYYLITGLLASIANSNKLAHRILKKTLRIEDKSAMENTTVDTNMEQEQNENFNLYSSETEPNIEFVNANDESVADDENDEEAISVEESGDDDDKDNGDFSLNDTSNTKANLLLLSVLVITHDLITKMPDLIRVYFEREGLLSDCITIIENLIELSQKDEKSKISSHTEAANFSLDFDLIDNYAFSLNGDKLCAHMIIIGRKIQQAYLSMTSSNSSNDLPSLMKALLEINDIITNLKLVKSFAFKEWSEVWNKLRFALHGGPEKVHISSFELISSGIIESIAFIFSSEDFDFGFEFNDCYKAFISVFFVDGSESDSVLYFVNKLQEALTRSETFEIISTSNSSSLYNNDNSATASMARQVKIKLSPENANENIIPQNMQNMIISVHAIATFKSIDSFLRQRFRLFEELTGFHNEEESEIEEDLNSIQNGIEEKPSTRIEFLMDGEVIPNETTIYGAIYRSLQSKPDEIVNPSKIWSNIHNVTFRKVEYIASKDSIPISYNLNTKDNELEIYDKITISILNLLKILFEMNTFVKNNIFTGRSIPTDSFTNWKLAVKLNRQLEELLVVASGTLPGWSIHVTKQFSFIFPFSSRIFFLQSTSFGYSRLIHHWQIRTNQETDENSNSSVNQRPQLGRPTRHKVRLSRKSILQSAIKVLSMYGSAPGILEIEYFEEVGSGLGPTLEFYSMVSKEFCRKKLKLWRTYNSADKNEDDFVDSPTGLFPAPIDKQKLSGDNGKKILQFFASLGKFIARALIDSRIIDFNFNSMFLKLIQHLNLNGNKKTSLKDIKKVANLSCLRAVDPHLASSMEHLLKYVKQFPKYHENERDLITIDGATLEQLSLSFTLPGYPDYELVPNGEEIGIDTSNVELYINKVLETTLYSGIINQTKAFMEGFSKVFPIGSLVIFSPEELVNLWGSGEEDWSVETLTATIHANHGYAKESDSVKSLINVLANFNDTERRLFLQFLTGAPRLPIGGFKALKPEFTVVKKSAETGMKDDDYLPSVMTCANYLKLPHYSNEEFMKMRLLQAMNEGAGAFLLS